MKRFLFILCAALTLPASAAPLDRAFDSLDGDYPLARLIGGGISLLGGGATALAGVALQMDGKAPTDETLIGLVGTGLGTVIAADGFIRLFSRSSAERVFPHYRNFPAGKPKEYGGDKDKAQYGEGILKEVADEGRHSRFLRGALDLMTSGCYWYLYAKGPKTVDARGNESGKDIYRHMIFPASFFAATALYRFLLSSPEEKAWAEYKEGSSRNSSTPVRWDVVGVLSPEAPFLAAVMTF